MSAELKGRFAEDTKVLYQITPLHHAIPKEGNGLQHVDPSAVCNKLSVDHLVSGIPPLTTNYGTNKCKFKGFI